MHDGPGPIPSSGVRPVCPSDAGLCFDRPSCFCRVCAVHFLGGTKYFDPVSPFYYSSRLRSVSLFRSVPRINDTFVATPFERFVALPVSTRFSPDFQKGCVSGYAVFLLSPQPTGLRGSLYFRFLLSPSFWFLITHLCFRFRSPFLIHHQPFSGLYVYCVCLILAPLKRTDSYLLWAGFVPTL